MHEATTDDLPGVHKSIISILWAQMNISPRSFFKKITTEKTHKGCDLPYKKNFCLHSNKIFQEHKLGGVALISQMHPNH